MRITFSTFFIFSLFLIAAFSEPASAQKQDAQKGNDRNQLSPQAVSPIRVDDFNYAVGALTDVGGANVSGGNWISNTGTGNFLQVSSGSLSYAGYPSSGIGNKLSIISATASAEDTFRNFPTQTSGTTYAAFMVNVTDTTGLAANTSTTGDYFAGFISSTSTTAFVNRVTIRAGTVPNTFQLGLRATGNAGNVQAFSSADLPVGTTTLVVISYQLVTGTANDVCNLWVNPTITGPEPAATLSQVSAADNADVGRFFIRQGSAGTPNASVDGLRVGTSWASLIATYLSPAPVDFNGDGRTDFVVARNTGGGPNGQLTWFWNLNGSANPTAAANWGLNLDTPVPADYDGDGKDDIAVWRPGSPMVAAFYILQSQTSTLRIELFGQTGDNPTVVADYNGDGKDDVAVYRPGAQGIWFYRTTPGGPVSYVPWGTTGDIVAPGDYNGDGTADFAIVRSDSGKLRYWQLLSTGTVDSSNVFGNTGDAPVTGYFDADTKTDLAVVRFDGGVDTWYWRPSGGGADQQATFGISSDTLAPGDYDGDGKTDPAVFRNGVFYSLNSSNGGINYFSLGASGDRVPAAFNAH